jgi:hypothetical protein
MNRGKFTRHLLAHGCFLHHHGANHDAWTKGGQKKIVSLPRRRNVDPSIIRAICRDLGIPPPPEK